MFDRCLYFNVNALARKLNRIWDQAFQDLGLSPSHAYTLRAILANPGMTHRELAEALQLEKSTITRFVDILQKKGLVQRMRFAGADRREMSIMPTVNAQQIQQSLESTAEQLYQQMIGLLGSQELPELVRGLRTVAKQL